MEEVKILKVNTQKAVSVDYMVLPELDNSIMKVNNIVKKNNIVQQEENHSNTLRSTVLVYNFLVKYIRYYRLYKVLKHIKHLAMIVFSKLGTGYNEGVYQDALKYELIEAGYNVKSEISFPIKYGNTYISGYNNRLDLLVNDEIILELKVKQGNPSLENINQIRRYFSSFITAKVGAIICFPNKGFNKNSSYRKGDLIGFSSFFYRY